MIINLVLIYLSVWGGESRILDKIETASYMTSYTSGVFGVLARQYSGFVPIFNSDFRKWQKSWKGWGLYCFFRYIMDLPVG